MNKLNSFIAAGLISLAGTGLAATPVLAGPMPGTTTMAQAGAPATKAVSKHANRQARVEKIQQALNKNGASLKVDGKWGPKTKAAIKDFQKAHSLKATGRLDKATRAQLLKA